MSILFGHPGGNPNSHHAALAHFEAGRLEAFCVPWMPSDKAITFLEHVPSLRSMAQRLSRRNFVPLKDAPKYQGRAAEFTRLLKRALGNADERLSYEANDWLMRTMSRECHRSAVTAVHSYEDCSLLQFAKAKRLGKACIYDMPIGYYPAWQEIQQLLTVQYADWLPHGGLPSSRLVRPEQKVREMELADLVLAPSTFVAETIHRFYPTKTVALAPYGVDADLWTPSISMKGQPKDDVTFLFVGQCSVRKGVPLLLDAWRAAAFRNAKLLLVGQWQLSKSKLKELPPQAIWAGPVSASRLRDFYREADLFVFPSYFEGRSLAVGEALSSGLPVLSTPASGYEDLINDSCGKLVPTGDFEALIEGLRWFYMHRDNLASLREGARAKAELCGWSNYRRHVTAAVTPYV